MKISRLWYYNTSGKIPRIHLFTLVLKFTNVYAAWQSKEMIGLVLSIIMEWIL